MEVGFAEEMESVTLEYRRDNDRPAPSTRSSDSSASASGPATTPIQTRTPIIMTTPPLKSKSYREKYERLQTEQLERWGECTRCQAF